MVILGKLLFKIGEAIDTIGFKLTMVFDTGALCVVGYKMGKYATKIQTIGCKMWWVNKFYKEQGWEGY